MPLVQQPELTVEDFTMIRDFIHERSGIYFAENKMYLVKNRLLKRMADLDIKTYRDYFYHIKYDTSQREFNAMMNIITTNETSFFRNEPQLLSFSDEILPLLFQRGAENGNKTIRIWSAGCSTGEEPYTLAIILLEKMQRHVGWKTEIIANDISEQALQRARRGEYRGVTLRAVKPSILERYFTKVEDIYQVKPEVKALVSYSHINLNDPRKLSLNCGFDVVFCRNVMIYFSDDVRKQLVRGFYNCLQPGGYLYIGHSETLHGISRAFKLAYFKNALVYQKEEVDTAVKARHTDPMLLNATAGLTPGVGKAIDPLSKTKASTTKR